MKKKTIQIGDVVYFENGTTVLVAPPLHMDDNHPTKCHVIEITQDQDNCIMHNEFFSFDAFLDTYRICGNITNISNINNLV